MPWLLIGVARRRASLVASLGADFLDPSLGSILCTGAVRVIARHTLMDFWQRHRETEQPLRDWLSVVRSLTAAQEKQLTVFGIRASLGLAVGPKDIKQQLSRSELAEMIATGLNSNGLLCAKLVKVQPLQREGYYEASCIAYRGGSGEKHYVIESATGIAFEA